MTCDKKAVDAYYLMNFSDIKFPFIQKITKNKKECGSLFRIINNGFPMTKTYLFKMKIADSPKCLCGTLNQDLNHLFWECPILMSERILLYKILRKLNLMDPFSIEYLVGNLNKKIAAIKSKFVNIINSKLDLNKLDLELLHCTLVLIVRGSSF